MWPDEICRRELRNIALRAAITLGLLFVVWKLSEPSFAKDIEHPIGLFLLWWMVGQGGTHLIDGVCDRFGWLPQRLDR